MEEVKKRTEVVRAFLSGKSKTLYKQTTAESICLQVRKILELIALASLVANKEEYAKVRLNFAKNYHAKWIFNTIETINPKFYPCPTKQVFDSARKKVIRVEEVKSGFLTRLELECIYDRCGGLLHAENPFGAKKDIDNFLKVVPQWMNKIIKLLEHHQIQLVNDSQQLWVIMNGKADKKVHVTLFRRE
jgi:hypothetical protein